MLEFLSNLFSEGVNYRTINEYRSAISAYHEEAEGISIGQHPKVCQLFSGVFNKRPGQPKYTVIWNISKGNSGWLPDLENLEGLGNLESNQVALKTLKNKYFSAENLGKP